MDNRYVYILVSVTQYYQFYAGRRNNMEMYGCNCGTRSFLTKEEKLEILKEYKESLENEGKGVSERIKELEKNK